MRLGDDDGIDEGCHQGLQLLAPAGDRGCRLIQQTGNLAVCEFEGLQPCLIRQLGIPLLDEGNECLPQFQEAVGGEQILHRRDFVAFKLAGLVLMVEGADHDGRVRLPELLEFAALALDGQSLRLIAAGRIVRIRHPARAPLDAAAPIGNLAAAVLPFGVLLGEFIADVFQVPLALHFGRGVHKDLHAVDGGGVFAGNHDRVDDPVAKAGSGDFQAALPGEGCDAGVGDLQRVEIIVLAGDGVLAYVAEALRGGVAGTTLIDSVCHISAPF